MTRKSHKGITGKNPAKSNKNVGPGLSFTDNDLRTGDEIDQAVKKSSKR